MSRTTQAWFDFVAITCTARLHHYLLLLEVLAFEHAHIASGSHSTVVEWYHWCTAVHSLLHQAASVRSDLVESGLHIHSIDFYPWVRELRMLVNSLPTPGGAPTSRTHPTITLEDDPDHTLHPEDFDDDKDKIRQANAHLKGGAALYMKEKLEMAYKTLDPKHTAQSMLDVHCAIHHNTMITFTENFRSYAPESRYSDEDLIVKIREQQSAHIQTVMSVTETLDPTKIPTTWMDYLEFCLEIEIKHLQQLSGNKSTRQTTMSKAAAPKDSNAMDTSTRITHELFPEQDQWLANKLSLKQAIAALRGMKTSTPTSSIGKGKAKQNDVASTALASTIKDTTARILELDEFSEDFQYKA
ncbi:uncharacterized protein LAESUDRAFT_760576 [Laetiporus sulphureus 93-53]|uniref:Uncharacterized protein n=1 Tax=Laetiporus sulphureus 93-53 TaxID=1314785 RepID=A0A165DL75_9APHY|nr:uncharacterized protein LAESUDRAFT_760576 [Laetiporus sulphureus 93-53]KZT05127.1 hypothetical protein LAESUDRAFT_760576 [Laetiporus sulphureus 93-53]